MHAIILFHAIARNINEGNQWHNNIIELNRQEVSTFLTYIRNVDIFVNAGVPG